MRIIKEEDGMPISLAYAKEHLRVGDNACDDSIITAKLLSAIAIAEKFTNRIIRQRTVELPIDLCGGSVIEIPSASEVISIDYIDFFGVKQPLPQEYYTAYVFDFGLKVQIIHPPKVTTQKLLEKSWATCYAGYTSETIPGGLGAAILLILGTLYDNESDELVGRSVSMLSLSAERILETYRIKPGM